MNAPPHASARVAAALALLSAAVAAQQAPPRSRGGIDVVRIEVSVPDTPAGPCAV